MSTPRAIAALATLALATSLTITAPVGAQSGTPDPTFGAAGVVYTPIPSNVYGLATQLDGKIVAAGVTVDQRWGIARLNPDGSPDFTFGTDGAVVLFGDAYEYASDVAIDAAGGILVTGWDIRPGDGGFFTVVRLLPDGSLDPAFGDSGIASLQIGKGSLSNSIALQPDGKILVGGYAYGKRGYGFALARFHPDGTLDTDSFAPSGKKKRIVYKGYLLHDIDARKNDMTNDGVIALQDDGRILLGGYTGYPIQDSWTIARYNSNGTVDSSFGAGGAVIQTFSGLDYVQLRGIGTDGGRIYASGRGWPAGPAIFDALLAAYGPNGALDSSFGTGGLALSGSMHEDNGAGLAVQDDGYVVVCANADNGPVFNVTAFRFDEFGDLDPGFDGDGMAAFAGTVDAGAREVILDAGGDILVGGWSDNQGVVVRYLK